LDPHPDAVRAKIKDIIASIKPLDEGVVELSDDAPLFGGDSGHPSPVNLDSLDALDLAMSIGDEFGLDNEAFERLVASDAGLDSLRTVNDITDLVVSLLGGEGGAGGPDLARKEVTA
jgi:acyl carrier protein